LRSCRRDSALLEGLQRKRLNGRHGRGTCKSCQQGAGQQERTSEHQHPIGNPFHPPFKPLLSQSLHPWLAFDSLSALLFLQQLQTPFPLHFLKALNLASLRTTPQISSALDFPLQRRAALPFPLSFSLNPLHPPFLLQNPPRNPSVFPFSILFIYRLLCPRPHLPFARALTPLVWTAILVPSPTTTESLCTLSPSQLWDASLIQRRPSTPPILTEISPKSRCMNCRNVITIREALSRFVVAYYLADTPNTFMSVGWG
jgi:hypothetical protein